MTYLNSSLDTLKLDGLRLPDAVVLHVSKATCLAIDTPRALALGVLGSQLSKHSDGTGTRVLDERSGDDLQSISNSLVRPLLDALDALCQLP